MSLLLAAAGLVGGRQRLQILRMEGPKCPGETSAFFLTLRKKHLRRLLPLPSSDQRADTPHNLLKRGMGHCQ